MPEIAMLNPVVLRGVVNKMEPPRTYLGTQLLPRVPYPYPVFSYDVVKGNRNLAKPNVPNAEANVVKQQTAGKVSGSMIYVREKKVFEPTTMYWLRSPGSLDTGRAERKVAEEIRDLNLRTERFVEWTIWSMFAGSIALNSNGVVATINYGIDPTHTPTAAVEWDTVVSGVYNTQIEKDLRAWRRVVSRDSFVSPTRVITSEWTMGLITQNSTLRNTNFMSDRMREQIAAGGTFGPLFGFDFTTYDLSYIDDAGVEQRFIPDGKLFMYAPENNPCELLEGPTADFDAPQGFTGKFSKSWMIEDPSARQALIEYNFVPTLPRPEQVLFATVAVAPFT